MVGKKEDNSGRSSASNMKKKNCREGVGCGHLGGGNGGHTEKKGRGVTCGEAECNGPRSSAEKTKSIQKGTISVKVILAYTEIKGDD